ncbi:(+)-neomenthol dehydrogenase-like [Coffea arabica]|uniref:(+)-neomenthol dehydrogenase-like n=1 Tax=Coffea arabica TaxID=13443 RepID=A0ABM4V339_COFAR
MTFPRLKNHHLVPLARYAVVTGANKRIGFAICNGLAFHGITVVLTARDEKRDSMLFTSTKGLVNNVAVLGNIHDVRRAALWNAWKQIGPKRMIEAFLPLLQSSQSPSIVSASSLLQRATASSPLIYLDEVLNEYLKDFIKAGAHGAKGWPLACAISKASLNAYTRILAKKLPSFKVICVYPGFVKTDMSHNIGLLTPEEGAESPVRLALLPDDGPSSLFFSQKECHFQDYAVLPSNQRTFLTIYWLLRINIYWLGFCNTNSSIGTLRGTELGNLLLQEYGFSNSSSCIGCHFNLTEMN